MDDAEKREKVIRGLELCACTDCVGCPYRGVSPCQNKLAADALALLREQEPKAKPQFDDDALDRNTYIKVGDLIDCMTELLMPEDAAFYLEGAIEWACGKRAVALLREQEAMVVTTADFGNNPNHDDGYAGEEYKDGSRCGGNTINVIAARAFKDLRRYWTSRPTPGQMWEPKGEDK